MKTNQINPIRIIPFLDIKNGLLIKGINLEGLRVLGKAKHFSNFYYQKVPTKFVISITLLHYMELIIYQNL